MHVSRTPKHPEVGQVRSSSRHTLKRNTVGTRVPDPVANISHSEKSISPKSLSQVSISEQIIIPSSGFITGVSVDIVGQGNCEIYVTTSSKELIPATIYGVKITPDLATRTNGAFTRIFRGRQAVRNGCSVLFSPSENSLSLPDGTNIPLDSENGLY